MKPTIGRVVYFYDNSSAREKAALVADVEVRDNDTFVNLTVSSYNGYSHGVTGIRFYEDMDTINELDMSNNKWNAYATWMPYQKQQQAKSLSTDEAIAGMNAERAGILSTGAPAISTLQFGESRMFVDKLTEEAVRAVVIKEAYYNFPDTTLTVCCLHLRNGYTVTGESACVTEANFDKEVGQKLAYDQAFNKIWQLEGYLLKEAHKMIAELKQPKNGE